MCQRRLAQGDRRNFNGNRDIRRERSAGVVLDTSRDGLRVEGILPADRRLTSRSDSDVMRSGRGRNPRVVEAVPDGRVGRRMRRSVISARKFLAFVAISTVGIAARADEAPPGEARPSVVADAPLLPKDWLRTVEIIPKTAIGVREEEAEAYFRVLDFLNGVTEAQLRDEELRFRRNRIAAYSRRIEEIYEQERVQDPQGAELKREKRREQAETFRADPFTYPLVIDAFNRPSECHGEVVSFRGHVRKVTKYPPTENDYGIDDLYELWLFDEEGRGMPVVVVVRELPQGFPVNLREKDVIDGVSVRGYLFKMYAYRGQEQLHAVPLILAKTVSWAPVVPPAAPSMPPWGYGLAIAITLLLLVLIVRGRRRDPRLQELRERLAPPDANPFNNLENDAP